MFSLSTDDSEQFSRPSIDVLFETAAFVYVAQTIGILLTGANRDGTHGFQEIKKYGGATIAQDPATAECGVMLGSAVDVSAVDYALPLEPIGPFTTELANRKMPWERQEENESKMESNSTARIALPRFASKRSETTNGCFPFRTTESASYRNPESAFLKFFCA